VLEPLGYKLGNAVSVEIMMRDKVIKAYSPGIPLSSIISYEQERGGYIDEDGSFTIDDVMDEPQNDSPYFVEQELYTLNSPKGATVYMNQDELLDFINDIAEYIDFKCSIKFRRLVDKSKNPYEWSDCDG
jgi:hypothetical protein